MEFLEHSEIKKGVKNTPFFNEFFVQKNEFLLFLIL